MKNGSFKNFLFMGSRNWFMIHKCVVVIVFVDFLKKLIFILHKTKHQLRNTD